MTACCHILANDYRQPVQKQMAVPEIGTQSVKTMPVFSRMPDPAILYLVTRVLVWKPPVTFFPSSLFRYILKDSR